MKPATDLLPPHPTGRTFSAQRTVRLGDVDPHGELRLDGISRYLQDIATDDAKAAQLTNVMGWVVRRTMIKVEHPGRIDEQLDLTTFCTGAGRSWAERRTSISGDQGASVEAVSLWVQVDPVTGRPARLTEEFFEIWGDVARERVVSSKLSLEAPPPSAPTQPWKFRRTDLDPFVHVNNAAHWAVVEELLQTEGWARQGVGELEFMAAIGPDDSTELVADGTDMWVVVAGKPATAARWTPSP